TIIGVLAEKGTSFGQSQDDICMMPITRFFEDFGEAKRTVNIATQSFSQETYNGTLDRGIGAMRTARGLRADQENDFEIYSSDWRRLAGCLAEAGHYFPLRPGVCRACRLLSDWHRIRALSGLPGSRSRPY